MDADEVVDDELETRQAHTRRRQLRELERQRGIAHVEHQLHRDLRQCFFAMYYDLER